MLFLDDGGCFALTGKIFDGSISIRISSVPIKSEISCPRIDDVSAYLSGASLLSTCVEKTDLVESLSTSNTMQSTVCFSPGVLTMRDQLSVSLTVLTMVKS